MCTHTYKSTYISDACIFKYTFIVHIYVYTYIATGWRRFIGCLILIGHFLQKSPMISGSFAQITCNLRHPVGLYDSQPTSHANTHTCTHTHTHTCTYTSAFTAGTICSSSGIFFEYVYVHIHVYACLHTYAQIYVYMHRYIYMYIYIHVDTYT